MEISLREYQTRAIERIRESIKAGHKRILVAAPCGAGKMVAAAYIMSQAAKKGKRAVFIADQIELVDQCARELIRFGVPFDTVTAEGWSREFGSLCTVVSRDTFWQRAFRRSKMPKIDADVLVWDEAHRNYSKIFHGVATHYPDSFVIGFTATPCRHDGRGLGNFYTSLILMATYKELIEAGSLVPVRLYAPSEPDLKGVKVRAGDYVQEQVEQRMDKPALIGDIVETWIKRGECRSTVVFASGVAHSIHLKDMFLSANIPAAHIDAQTPIEERREIMEKVRTGDIRVLCNFGIATTGLDIPRLKCAVMARPTKSLIVWRQCLGRILRPYEGYNDAIVLDHSGGWRLHGFPDEDLAWRLDVTKKAYEEDEEDNVPRKRVVKCPNCSAVCKGGSCSECGWVRQTFREGKSLGVEDGELEYVERSSYKKHTIAQKQLSWDRFLGVAIGRNLKVGAAAHMYRRMYGTWPPSCLKRVPRSVQWRLTAREFYRRYVNGEAEAPPGTND